MKVRGRLLSDQARSRVQRPFCKNEGEQWSLALIKEYVDKGVEMAEQDAETKSAINGGLRLIGDGEQDGA
jgi:hypothetical protein